MNVPRLKELLITQYRRQVDIANLVTEALPIYGAFLSHHRSHLGSDGSVHDDFVEVTRGMITRIYGNWGTNLVQRTWIVAVVDGGDKPADTLDGNHRNTNTAVSVAQAVGLGRSGLTSVFIPRMTIQGEALVSLLRCQGGLFELMAMWHRDATIGQELPVPLSELPERSRALILDRNMRRDVQNALVCENALELYGCRGRAVGQNLLRLGLHTGLLTHCVSGSDEAMVPCIQLDLMEFYLVHLILHATRCDRQSGEEDRYRRLLPDAGDYMDPWAVFSTTGQGILGGLSEIADMANGVGMPTGGLVDRLCESPYHTLVLDLARNLWPHAITATTSTFTKKLANDGRLCELTARLMVELWLSAGVVSSCGKAAIAREVAASALRAEVRVPQASQVRGSLQNDDRGGISVLDREPAYVQPTEKQVQALIVVSAHLLSHPELHTLCRVVEAEEYKRLGVSGVYKHPDHPLAIMREELVGFLASSFSKVNPIEQCSVFVNLLHLWLLWMEPWTHVDYIRSRVSEEDPSVWVSWITANEDMYCDVLVPFLARMGDVEYEGSRRDFQLKALERVMAVFSGHTLEVLKGTPTDMLQSTLDRRFEEVTGFLKDLKHKIMFGNWLNPNLDYDDIANYALWVVVMVAAQAAQVLELIVKGNSARWRLEKLITDLADVCGRSNSEVKEAMTTHSSGRSDTRVGKHRKQDDWKQNPWAGPLCSYELKPLYLIAFALAQWSAIGMDRWDKYKGHFDSSKPRPPYNLRFIADYRNWSFFVSIFAVMVFKPIRDIVTSTSSILILLACIFFYRYPHWWHRLRNGNWWDSTVDYFD